VCHGSGPSDFTYASTASASARVIRNCGIGGLGGAPVLEMPVINSITNWASVPGGEPASLGATTAHVLVGTLGRMRTAAPISQRERSGLPVLSIGV
jgi:hypothetical protein